MMRYRYLLSILVLAVAGCGGEPEPFETQVRRLVAEAESAAEAKDLDALMSVIADDYSGPMREAKRDLENLARFTFSRHAAIHLYTRISEVQFMDSTQARTTVYVAMSGRPIPGPEELDGLRGSLWRFDVLARRDDGEARVTQAQWRRAQPADFF